MDSNTIKDLEKKVQAGDVASMAELAKYYLNESVNGKKYRRKAQYKNAMYYYELASNKGDLKSRFVLADMYLHDFFLFAAWNLLVVGGTSDFVFKLRGSSKEIIKGLNLMFSIIEYNEINDSARNSKTAVNSKVVEAAAFYIYFISGDYRYIRTNRQKGKFLDRVKDSLEEYGEKSWKLISKYKDTEYYKIWSQQYYNNIKQHE